MDAGGFRTRYASAAQQAVRAHWREGKRKLAPPELEQIWNNLAVLPCFEGWLPAGAVAKLLFFKKNSWSG
jgi:hypothetical protein